MRKSLVEPTTAKNLEDKFDRGDEVLDYFDRSKAQVTAPSAEKLRQILNEGDTVLFIGSGISSWSGLPTWSQLIEDLARFVETSGESAELVRSEARKGELLQAASYGFDKLTKQQIGDFVRTACQLGIAQPHEIHKQIVTLGPRCFITTNYDNLIEEGLRRWQPDRFYRPPITNRQLAETAEIVQARATDFVFKPHGDAADAASIILTREQYRLLLPGGERHNALESLKMLMLSRPVVYLGFGLRDPDFLYVRDLLTLTYQGAIRDHYAIIADVSEGEIDYWRRNYGIHVSGYQTTEGPDKQRDHSNLLSLLRSLQRPTTDEAHKAPLARPSNVVSADLLLSLTRHASRLSAAPKLSPEIPLRIHLDAGPNYRAPGPHRLDKFNNSTVESFLDEGPNKLVLIGLPGAGKTYALRRAAARGAEKLHDACLREPFDPKSVSIPLFADLKLYQGDLWNLVEKTLPAGIALDGLKKDFKIKVFLDSFNEMPREYWESGLYEADFSAFITRIGTASLIIGSRSNDGLTNLDLPAYRLDEIDPEFAEAELRKIPFAHTGRFQVEIAQLLRKPFYFQLITKGIVSLPEEPHPRDIYHSFFQRLSADFQSRFGVTLNIERVLSVAGYEGINRGEEAQPLAMLLKLVGLQLESGGDTMVTVEDLVNWLISRSVLLPYSGSRIAFFHQSVTEFLAANELARRFKEAPRVLKEKLSLKRWDQALFLTLSVLSEKEATAFLNAIVESDFALALHATKYLEADRDLIVGKLLEQIPQQIREHEFLESGIELALGYAVPLTVAHESALRAIVACGNMIGGVAAKRLIKLKGAEVKEEFLDSIVVRREDFNYCCNGVASALGPLITAEDLPRLLAMTDSLKEEFDAADEDALGGFTSAVGMLLEHLDLSVIADTFLNVPVGDDLSAIRAEIICEVLRDRGTTEALQLAADLLLRGVDRVATVIYFIGEFEKPPKKLSWQMFTRAHVERLMAIFSRKEPEPWALDALSIISKVRSDLNKHVDKRIAATRGLTKALLLHATRSNDPEPLFTALSDLLLMQPKERKKQPVLLLSHIELEWEGQEELLIALLRLRDSTLAFEILESVRPPLGPVNIGAIDWWLEWLGDDGEENWFFQDRLSSFFARYLDPVTQREFVREFNGQQTPYRKTLARTVLIARADLSTDDFSEDALSFLLSDLSKTGSVDHFRGHLLGHTATERFVEERLLPLITEATKTFRHNLQRVLRQAGNRHGRRYLG
jgi:hypothetical protein